MKKRSKSYRPRDVAIPKLFAVLTIGQQQPNLALRIYMAIETFCSAPTIEASNHLGMLVLTVAEALSIMRHRREGKTVLGDLRDPASIAVVTAIRTFTAVNARYEQFGVMDVRALDIQSLRAVAGKLDEALDTIPVTIWHEAVVKMRLDEAAINAFLIEQRELRKAA